MSAENKSTNPSPQSALRQAVELINKDPLAVYDETRFRKISEDGSNSYGAERLRYFAMAQILSERAVPRLQTVGSTYPPYGLPELYRDKDMLGPDWRGLTSFEPDGTISRETRWGILHSAYQSKMIIVLHEQLEQDLKDIQPIVRQMALHRPAGYHVNTKSDDDEVYYRLDQQTFNAVDVMVGLLRLIPELTKDTQADPLAVARNSKSLSVALSGLSIVQFQHFLHEVLEGASRDAGVEGWDFNPKYFKIDFTRNQLEGKLTTIEPLLELEVTYPMRRISPWDEFLSFPISAVCY